MTALATRRAGRREWIGLAVIALPCLLATMDLEVLNLAVPALTADLQPSSAQLLPGHVHATQLARELTQTEPCLAGLVDLDAVHDDEATCRSGESHVQAPESLGRLRHQQVRSDHDHGVEFESLDETDLDALNQELAG